MESTTRLAKTAKGREEIEHRRYRLPGKIRTLLILIDGTRTIDEVARDAQKLGAPEDAVIQLMRDGFVAPVPGKPGAAARTADAARPAAATPGPSTTGSDTAGEGITRTRPDEYEKFRIAKQFMNETAVDNLGAVKKFTFTLRLERCAVRDDLAQLLPEYEEALTRAIGIAGTSVLVEKLRSLLG